MKIPDELLKKWNDLRSFGDGKKIVELNPEISPAEVSRAFTSGECSDRVFEIMGEFFKNKDDKIKEYL